MSGAAREDTITDLLANYLRDNGVNAATRMRLDVPGEWPKEPDLTIKNDGIFVGEAKWEDDFFRAIAEAHDYGLAPTVNGSIAIAYSNDLKQEVQQARLGEAGSDVVLSGHEFQVAFLGRKEGTATAKVALADLPDWINDHIYQRVEPETDPEQVVELFRQAARSLTEEISDIETPDLFRNVLGLTPEEDEQIQAARHAAGYLLVNQIAFYRVLSSVIDKYPDIDPAKLERPGDLQDYFAVVLEDDYSAIFSFPVSKAYTQRHLPLLKETVSGIYGLRPEQIDHEVLGTVFHALTPLSVRKPIAAYYTSNKSAEILADLAIDDPNMKVIDPACGSGTLLTAAYRKKRELTENFNEEDHRRFLMDEITGIDIMPFAAHLSTIHLALEQPAYQTERVRIGIEDSTKIAPGKEISPIEQFLPESEEVQRAISDWESDRQNKTGSSVEEEEISDQSPAELSDLQHPINLEKVDVVIMNPPFSRQESVSQFGSEYKQNLRERFEDYADVIHGKMSFSSYFLLLADKFLDNGGKIAAVLPASFLTKSSDRKVRRYILDKYGIEYLVSREDKPNFSEDTDFREILFIAEKGAEMDRISYVSLNNFDADTKEIRKDAQKVTEGLTRGKNYVLQQIPGTEIEEHNLFAPLTVQNHELFEISTNILSQNILTKFEDLDAGLIGGVGSGGRGIDPDSKDKDWQEGVINHPSSEGLRDHDMWVLAEDKENSIIANHRFVNYEIEISKAKLVPDFRRTPNRAELNVSGFEEYAVIEPPDDERFFDVGEYDYVPRNWSGEVANRLGHLCIMRRIDLTAPGTRHLSYYSDENRLFHGTMWLATDTDQETSKYLALWFDSSFNFLQMLINRVPARGGYTEYHKHTVSRFRVLNPAKLSEEQSNQLLDTFDEVGNMEFPSLVDQLAMNTPIEVLTSGERERLLNAYEDTGDLIGQGFEPRKTIDETILNILGIEDDELLVRLYPALLNELVSLKLMMD